MTHSNPGRNLQRIAIVSTSLDDPSSASRALEAHGFAVTRAADARELELVCRRTPHDLVIADAALARSTSALPWLATVDELDGAAVERAFETGAADVVTRSVGVDELAARVQHALRAWGTTRELERLRMRIDLARRMGAWATWELDVATGELECSRECQLALGLDHDRAPRHIDDLRDRMPAERRPEFDAWLAAVRAGSTHEPFEHPLLDLRVEDRTLTHVAVVESSSAGQGARIQALVRVRGALPSNDVPLPSDLGRSGLLDREQLLVSLERAQREAQRAGRHVGVMFVGVDRTKSALASLSHRAAEDLSSTIADRLREGLRERDVVGHLDGSGEAVRIARVRGDEFAIVLPRLQRVPDAAKVGSRLVDLLSVPFDVGGRELCVSVDVGIACFPDDHNDADELLRRAETAAYCARQEGHGTVKFYTTAMDSRAFERLTLETSLRRALERSELALYYQPRVELRSQRIVGVEALVRWKHPDLGFIAPSQFIPLAEETGLIIPIGEWVLREACRQNRAWQDSGIAPIRMAVNLSTVQFRQPALHDVVKSALAQTKLEAKWLELELTESTLMQDSASAVETLERLERSGIHLSIDDFGTGYSSLAYLKRFPIDALKIDRSFIRDATSNADDAAIVTSIILMGRSLKLSVVAEGVETQSQLSFLRVLQCDEAQGYLFSPPVPAEDATRMLREGLQLNVAA